MKTFCQIFYSKKDFERLSQPPMTYRQVDIGQDKKQPRSTFQQGKRMCKQKSDTFGLSMCFMDVKVESE